MRTGRRPGAAGAAAGGGPARAGTVQVVPSRWRALKSFSLTTRTRRVALLWVVIAATITLGEAGAGPAPAPRGDSPGVPVEAPVGSSIAPVGARAAGAETIAPEDVGRRIDAKDAALVLLDVRSPEEFAGGHIPGARNIPHDQVAARIVELGPLRANEVVVYCRSGRRAALAIEILRAQGFGAVRHLDGDMVGWSEAGRPIETGPAPLSDGPGR